VVAHGARVWAIEVAGDRQEQRAEAFRKLYRRPVWLLGGGGLKLERILRPPGTRLVCVRIRQSGFRADDLARAAGQHPGSVLSFTR
jgi:hypothetical protein